MNLPSNPKKECAVFERTEKGKIRGLCAMSGAVAIFLKACYEEGSEKGWVSLFQYPFCTLFLIIIFAFELPQVSVKQSLHHELTLQEHLIQKQIGQLFSIALLTILQP